MEVNTANSPLHLVETDIIESLEAGTRDRSNPVVRNEEIFLPPHEHVLTLREVAVCEIGPFGLFRQRLPRWES